MFICNDFTDIEFLSGVVGIVFDCDGVMFDSMEANRRYYNLVLEGLGLGPMDRDQERYVHAHMVRDSIARIVPPERVREAEEIRKSIDYRKVLPFLRPESGLYSLLSMLSAVGIRCAVYTNRTTTMDLVLEMFALRRYFHPVVTASTVQAKPHPEGMHKILEHWGAKPHQIAYIGDSEVDAVTAEASGVPFWSYKNEMLTAGMHLHDFWSLRRCLQRAYPEAARGF